MWFVQSMISRVNSIRSEGVLRMRLKGSCSWLSLESADGEAPPLREENIVMVRGRMNY